MAGSVRFEGKVVIVTGAGGPGTGGAAARRFASEGAQVVASDVDEQGLENLVKSAEVGHGGKIVTRRCDVTEADDVDALVQFAVSTLGRLDVMINHAIGGMRRTQSEGGGSQGGGSPFSRPLVPDIELDAWRDGIAGVLHSVFYGCRVAIPHLTETRGCIVNTASISGMGGDYGMAAYDSAKAGVINLTKALAVDHGDDGIRINCVSPGAIAYPSGNMFASVEGPYLERVPLRRFASPDDIAAAMAFLASDDASYITGHNLVVDGGITAASGQYPFVRHFRAEGTSLG
jgi:meso-butanediol dehydrogenase/(S,S)-butanediol dehydrogenase/diacetyl reductase